MASTRISKYQAEELAKMLAAGFTQKERAQLIERQAAAHRSIADRLFTPELIAQITGMQAALPDAMRAPTVSDYVYLLDQKGEQRGPNVSHRLDYGIAYGAEDNRTFAIDLRCAPKIKVTQRQYDNYISANEAMEGLATRTTALRRELLNNILAARTVEKLLEKWPEAGSAIATFFNHQAAVTAVEVPLEQLVRRHCSAPALAAPVEG